MPTFDFFYRLSNLENEAHRKLPAFVLDNGHLHCPKCAHRADTYITIHDHHVPLRGTTVYPDDHLNTIPNEQPWYEAVRCENEECHYIGPIPWDLLTTLIKTPGMRRLPRRTPPPALALRGRPMKPIPCTDPECEGTLRTEQT